MQEVAVYLELHSVRLPPPSTLLHPQPIFVRFLIWASYLLMLPISGIQCVFVEQEIQFFVKVTTVAVRKTELRASEMTQSVRALAMTLVTQVLSQEPTQWKQNRLLEVVL